MNKFNSYAKTILKEIENIEQYAKDNNYMYRYYKYSLSILWHSIIFY